MGGRGRGRGAIKWEKVGGQGERKLFMRTSRKGGVLQALTNNEGERSDGNRHPASVLGGWCGRGGVGDLKSSIKRVLRALTRCLHGLLSPGR